MGDEHLQARPSLESLRMVLDDEASPELKRIMQDAMHLSPSELVVLFGFFDLLRSELARLASLHSIAPPPTYGATPTPALLDLIDAIRARTRPAALSAAGEIAAIREERDEEIARAVSAR